MKREELKEIPTANKVNPRSYRLEGGAGNDLYILEQSSGGWAVFYLERGNRSDERWFALDDAVSEHWLRLVLADPSVRIEKSLITSA